jgi:NlpC/P60 family putative phage cell wall peptidase
MIKRSEIVAAARQWINTPYHHQAAVRGVGCDCIGLLVGVWTDLIGQLPVAPPVYSPQWHLHQKESQLLKVLKESYGFVEINATTPPAGSVLCFGLEKGPAHHAAISTGNGTFIHSFATARKVVEVTLDPSWRKRLHAVMDYPEVMDG